MAMVSPENDYIVRLVNSLSGENSYAIEYCGRMCVLCNERSAASRIIN